MSAKLYRMAPPVGGQYRLRLEQLYARRAAIDTVIDDLKEYSRLRAKRAEERKRKTA
jgi:hypothetical protein